VKLWPALRRRQFPVGWAGRALLVSGAIVPTAFGATAIAVLTFWALPTGAALGERHVLLQNVVVCAIYTLIAVPIGAVWGYLWLTLPADADEALGRRTLLVLPVRMAIIHATVWTAAALMLVAINVATPWLAATLGVSVLLGGAVTAPLSYWWCTRALRPVYAQLLTRHPLTKPRGPGLRIRAVGAWVVGTGMPLMALLLVAASALVVHYPGHRLTWVVLALGGCAVASGLAITAFIGATTADPIDEVRRGMQRVERGDFDVSVPVFDASELGLLQAGFNTMASGLRERERLRDLFGRHVGRDVARLAEESASEDGRQVEMGGTNCEVAVLFIDLIGSTQLAVRLPPDDLVAMLNEFFAAVVDSVEHHNGWVNKFEGDAALAVFGAPVRTEDAAGDALAAACDLHKRLNSSETTVAGIGVSAGRVVAGNIGEPRRYEYTVIGDPVNEAARLSEFAKQSGGIAASGAALQRASSAEAARWRITESRMLRGRDTETDVAVPVDDLSR
jgi:adenylate cyclase